jgi:predicted amidohydrolase
MPDSTGEEHMDYEMWYRQWDVATAGRAIENMVYLAVCNHVGREENVILGGRSRILDPQGRVMNEATEEGVISADLDRDLLVRVRQHTPFLRDRRPDLYKVITCETEDTELARLP